MPYFPNLAGEIARRGIKKMKSEQRNSSGESLCEDARKEIERRLRKAYLRELRMILQFIRPLDK